MAPKIVQSIECDDGESIEQPNQPTNQTYTSQIITHQPNAYFILRGFTAC